MPDVSNNLLVQLQLAVEQAEEVERLVNLLNQLNAQRDDTIVETVEFDVRGLEDAQRKLEASGDLGDDAKRKIEAANQAFLNYGDTLKRVSRDLETLRSKQGILQDLRGIAQRFQFDPDSNRRVPGDIVDFERIGQLRQEAGGILGDDIFDKLELGRDQGALEAIDEQLDTITKRSERFKRELGLTGETAKQAEKDLLDLAASVKDTSSAQRDNAADVAKVSRETGQISKDSKEYVDALSEQAIQTDRAGNQAEQYAGQLQALVNAIEALPQRLEAATGQTTEAVEQLVTRMDRLSKSLDKVARSANAYVTQLKVLTRLQRESGTVIQGFARDAQKDMKDLGDTTAVYSRHAESARRSTIGFVTGSAQATTVGRQFNDVVGTTGIVVQNAARGTIGFHSGLESTATVSGKAAIGIESVGKTADKTSKDVDKGTKSVSNFTSAFRLLLTDRNKFGQVLEFAVGRLGIYAAAATIVYGVAAAIRTAITEAVKFEETLSQIQGVLPSRNEFSADIIGEAAIKNASRFGVSITEAAEAAKTFAQTGRDATQIAKDLEAAFLAVRGANLNVEQAKDLIIAIENITNGELEALQVLDRISRVESRRAITAQDLAVGFQRIGPLVRQLRGDMAGLVDEYDVASGALTTIVERTRVSGNNAATSLRFILSRLGRPDVIKQLQQLSGVGLGREGGRQLRPFVEILEDLSFAYQQLQRDGQSAQAFQLLATLGGARQLQATATLLENFSGTTLETARISATAFNDSAERTDIALDNIANSARKAGTAWATFAASLIDSIAVSEGVQGLFGLLGGAGNILAAGVGQLNSLADVLTRLFTGSQYRFTPVSFSDISEEQLARFDAFAATARENGQSVAAFTQQLNLLARQVSETASQQFGLPFNEMVEQLKSGEAEDSLRGLRELLGKEFADALEESTTVLDDLREKLNETSDPARQAELNAQRITRAFNILGSAIYTNTAILELNNEKITESTKSIFEDLLTSYSKATQQIRGDRNGLFENIFGRGRAPTQTPGTFQEFEEIAGFIRERSAIRNLSAELRTFDKALYESGNTFYLWREALRQAFEDPGDLPVTDRFLKAQDIFTESVLSSQNYSIIIEDLTNKIAQVLELGDDVTSTTIRSERLGQTALNNLNIITGDVVENLRKTRTLTSQQVQDIESVVTAFGSALAAQDAFIVSGQESFAKLNQELFNIFIQFTTAIKSAEQLDKIYGELGITFDRTNARFEATKTFLEGLVAIPTRLTGEAAQLFNQLQEAERSQPKGTAFEELGRNLATALESTGDLDGAQGIVNRNAEELRATYESLSLQLNSLDTLNLRSVFGSSPEGRQLLNDFKVFTEVQGENLLEDIVSMTILIGRAQDLLGIEFDIIAARERSRIILEAQAKDSISAAEFTATRIQQAQESELALERSRLDILARGLQITNTRGEALVFQADTLRRIAEEELSISRGRADRDISTANLEYQNALQEIQRQRVEEGLGDREAENKELQAKSELLSSITEIENEQALTSKQRLEQLKLEIQELSSGAIIDAYSALNNQINSNIQAASTGIRTVLRDYDALKKDAGKTILSPIADTFLDRIAENFTSSLFDATSDSFFGKIAEAYGSTPEQRLREQLDTSFTRGAQIMGAEFDEFIADLATVLGVSAPTNATSGVDGASLTVATGAEKSRNKILAEQFALLASTQIGTALGANLGGNQSNANFGASLGGVAGSFLPLALNGFAVGGPLGAIVGGIVGGLFGRNDEEKRHEEQLQALDKIEYNTGRSVSELELQRQFLEVARGAVNVPTGFNVPGFLPGGGTGGTQNNDITIQISVNNASNGEEVVQTIRRDLGPALTEELRKIGL